MSERKLFSVGELAEYWNCSADVVYDLLITGKIPGAFKVGRMWRIPESAVDKFESGQAETQAPQPPQPATGRGHKRVITKII